MSGQQQGKPDGQMYCGDIAEPVEADVGWRIANAVDWQPGNNASRSIGPKSRTERPRKSKISRGSPRHTWLGHHFQGQKVNLQGAGAYCGGLPHSLLLSVMVIVAMW